MAQETSSIQTQNSASSSPGLLDRVLGTLTGLVETAAPVYALKLQGDMLKNQTAASATATPTATAPASAGLSPTAKKWLMIGAIAAGVLLVIGLFRRSRD